MKKREHTKYYYIGFLFFFLIVLFLSPISGDDWGNYLEGSMGLRHIVGQAIGMYFSWEGRFVSRLLINLLTYHKWLWNLVNSFAIVGIVYYTDKIIHFKNRINMILLTFILILFMNIYTFSQVVTWVAGNITYLLVIPLLLLYMDRRIHKREEKKIDLTILILLNIIIPMFVEHTAVLLILLNSFFFLEEYWKQKKVKKKSIIYLVISIISFAIMFFSPGNALRNSVENLEFNQLNIIGKVFYNLPNYVFYTYMINYVLIPIMLVASFFLIHKYIKKRSIRVVLYLYEGISILITCFYLLNTFGILHTDLWSERNTFIILYYFLLTILNAFLLWKNTSKKKTNISFIFYGMGIMANAVMLMSPTWGYRTSIATYLFLGISFIAVIDEIIDQKKIWKIGLTTLCSLGMLFYLIFYINIHTAYLDNKENIEKSIKEENHTIELIAYPGFAPCNINPMNDYHLRRFKEYYGIKEEVEITYKTDKWKYLIFYQR